MVLTVVATNGPIFLVNNDLNFDQLTQSYNMASEDLELNTQAIRWCCFIIMELDSLISLSRYYFIFG